MKIEVTNKSNQTMKMRDMTPGTIFIHCGDPFLFMDPNGYSSNFHGTQNEFIAVNLKTNKFVGWGKNTVAWTVLDQRIKVTE